MTRLIRTILVALVATFALANTAVAQLPTTTLVAAPTAEETMAKKTANDMAPIPPVMPSNMRGWLDRVDYADPFTKKRMTYGWAVDLRMPDEPIAVRLYDGPKEEGRPLEPVITSYKRPDVQDAFPGWGVTADDRGFVADTPNRLCDGKEHFIYAYGVDPYTAEEIKLMGSGMPLLCAPANGNRWIQGIITNKKFGIPLTGQGYFGANYIVSRIDNQGNKHTFNWSRCEQGTIQLHGCPDEAGTFMLYNDMNGQPPTDGVYEIVVRANDHVEKTIRFTLPMTGHLEIKMDIVPASVQLVEYSPTVSKHGGMIRAKVRIINYESSDSEAAVDSIVNGPLLTKNWGQYEIHRTLGLSDTWTHYEVWIEIPIDARLPNDQFWSSVRIGKAHSRIEQYQEVQFPTVKR